jgi:flagellar basal body-associated protein FliL
VIKFIVKFENYANKVITKMTLLLIGLIKRLVPQKVKIFLITWEHKVILKRKQVIESTKERLEKLKEQVELKTKLVQDKQKQFQKKVQEIKRIDYKQQALEKRVMLRAYLKKTSPKKALILGLIYILKPIKIAWLWLKSQVSWNGFATYVSLSLVASFSGYMIYSNTQSIMQHGRAPASAEKKYDYKRPYYYKQLKKHSLFSNLKLPVYYKSKKNVTSLTIDFNIITNYRATLQQIEKHHIKIRDHLLMNVEPVQAEFPLETEGRDILKAKIKFEINQYLKHKGIEGQVQEVQIMYVLGT